MSKFLLKWLRDSCTSFSEQRILLINTPLQNTLKELWTMIHFLLPGITRPYSDFPVKAGTDQNQDYCHKLVIRLHRVSIAPAPSSALNWHLWFQLHEEYTKIRVVFLHVCRWSSRSSWGAPNEMWRSSFPRSMNTSWSAVCPADRKVFMRISSLSQGKNNH